MSELNVSRKLAHNILTNLPHNTNRQFAEIKLKDCLLYLPLRNAQVSNAKRIKDLYQDIFNRTEY